MKNSKIFIWSIINSISSFLYIVAVASIMFNGKSLFGDTATFWVPVSILLLFVLSATIVGTLVLGRPIYFYLNDQKSDAIKLLGCTIFWLFIFTLIVFSAQLIIK